MAIVRIRITHYCQKVKALGGIPEHARTIKKKIDNGELPGESESDGYRLYVDPATWLPTWPKTNNRAAAKEPPRQPAITQPPLIKLSSPLAAKILSQQGLIIRT